MNIYKTSKWIHKRLVILRRDDYMCRECKRYGKTTLASTVHHVIPIDKKPELTFVNNNLLSLCASCHDAMHNRELNELTALGLMWVIRLGLSPHLEK